MRTLKILIIGLLLAIPGLATADASDIPGAATWYLHIDLKKMQSEEAGKILYDWVEGEVFEDVREDAGIDLGKELDRVTGYSLDGQGPVFLFEGNISQESKDMAMTLIAAQGDLKAKKSSGKAYYRLTDGNSTDGNSDGEDDAPSIKGGDLEIQIEALEDESWISLDLKNRVVVTATEGQMKDMLANGGKIAGGGGHNSAILVLTAEKALLQAGINSVALGESDDGDSSWDSNILRNTEQVAFLVAAAANKLAFEAELITTEPEMAESLASVVRGLISLVAFNDEMDDEAINVLRGTKVEAKGNSLKISVAIDPGLVVATLGD